MSRDLEKQREYQRRWREANPEKQREYQRRYYQAHRAKKLDGQRRRDEASPEKRRERGRRDREANPEKHRERHRRWREANPEKMREHSRRYREANGRDGWLRRNHGMYPGDWAVLWVAQDGRCYLCGEPLPDDSAKVHIDHDHRCCPPNRSCRACRFGLAHSQCNQLVGMAADDPIKLLRIAGNRVAAMRRLGPFPELPALFEMEDPGLVKGTVGWNDEYLNPERTATP